ncbi:MAG: small conductance mechanosensitive channel [Candidatus Krumholzibacteriia bacterium]|jgi:small conductance mechanosensitive channel
MLLGMGWASISSAQESAADSVVVEAPTLTPIESARLQYDLVEAELDSLYRLEKRSLAAVDDELELIRVQAFQRIKAIDDLQPEFVKLMLALDPNDTESQTLRDSVFELYSGEWALYSRAFELWENRIVELRNMRRDVLAESEGDLESKIDSARRHIDELVARMSGLLELATEMEFDVTEPWQEFDNLVNARAENLIGRLQIAADRREELEKNLESAASAKASPDELAAKRARVQLAVDRIEGIAGSLTVAVDLLGSRGYETAKFDRFMIKTTGKISERFLDPKVFIGLVQDWGIKAWSWLDENGPTAFVKLLIVFLTVLGFRMVFRFFWWLTRVTGLIKLTRLMTQLGHSIIMPVGTFLGFFAGLWLVGVDPTTLLTGAGVAGVIIGLALQDSLSNLAAGFFLLTTRPFDVDDVIRSGEMMGTVKDMMIANTTIITFDGRRLLIPNRMLWAGVIENRSVEARRRVDVVVRVSFDENVDQVIASIEDHLQNDPRVLKSPEPQVFVGSWEDSWLEIAVRPWAKTEEWWNLYMNLPREIGLRFAAEGIEIPLPHRVVSSEDGGPAQNRDV